jgi:C4-dicarboxylate-specific signal transduction histidine kinase
MLLKRKLQGPITPDLTKAILDAFETIESNTSRISKIVKGLRTFSREGGKDPFHPLVIQSLIDDALGVCQERFRSAGVDLVVQNEAPLEHQIPARAVQLAQVLINLLNNAFDATESQRQRAIQMRIYVEGEQTHILVHDNGKGVSPEIEAKIMQPFFTTKEVGKGTGLGLSVSQGIIQDHGGRLFLDRAVGNSCFHIILPNQIATANPNVDSAAKSA